jgi:chorismate synthase
MSVNTFGNLFRFTTFGESHGPAIGCIVDGTPPGILLSEDDIQFHMNKRRPGHSKYTTQRKESDTVKILSGVFDGVTTGAPIGIEVKNEDTRSKDYEEIKDRFRPGHADFTYYQKYGVRDYRGGGRSSARETAMRVAAGAIARKILGDSIIIRGALIKMGNTAIDRKNWRWEEVDNNPFFSPDSEAVFKFETLLNKTRKDGSSVGAIIEIVASGIPPGIGAPIYGKLDADLAGAFMGIPAVKGVEIGAGFGAAQLTGAENADEMRMEDGLVTFLSNNAGGILGGISTGQDIVANFAVKPTSSILTPKRSVNTAGQDVEIKTKGRHDPCVGIRAVPIGEAMMACVLADHFLLHRAQCG